VERVTAVGVRVGARQRDQPAEHLGVADLQIPIFAGVEPALLERLVSRSLTRVFVANEQLLQEDEAARAFFVLHRGSVRVFYRSPSGFEVVVKLFRAPSVFGEMECINNIPYLETVEALEKVVALEVPRPVLLEALAASPALTRNLLDDVCARLCIAAQNERSLAFNPVEVRLANLLVTYVDFYGLPVAEGIKIRIPLTQDDLANGLGVARRSITRALKRWIEGGIVLKQARHFIVRDLTRLAQVTDPTLLRIGYRLGAALKKQEARGSAPAGAPRR
jgi:CRP-like cAMP-binding protein